jgi:PLP dependent protein
LHPNQSDGLVYPSGLHWHMIGHLQTNKVKDAVRIFDLIQSVDSMRLAEAISKEASRINKVQDVLIEIKTSSEAAKFGAAPEEAAALLAGAGQLDAIRIKGLMTIAPAVEDPKKARIYFRQLKSILDAHNARCPEALRLKELSMGMSDDFEVAVEEGATMVRIGRALFQ